METNIPVLRFESIANDAYNEFYKKHKDLFLNNISEYWVFASRYKENEVSDKTYSYRIRVHKKNDFDPTEDIYRD